MKKLTLFLLLVLCALNLDAQDAVRKVHFGVTVNPQLNFTSFEKVPNVKKENSFCLGVSGDLFINLTGSTQIKTGIAFQYLTLNHRDGTAHWPHQGNNGEWKPDQSYIGYDTRYIFAGIPIYLKVKTQAKTNHVYVTGGVVPGVLISYDGNIVTNEAGHITKYGTPEGLFYPASLFTTIGLGVGYEREMGKRKIFVEPNFQYSAGLFFKDSTVSSRSNGHIGLVGIKMGLIL